MHAKHLSIDDEISVIGSSNMDIRSFLLNAEASLVIYDQPVTRRLQAEQQRILAASDRLVLSEWARRHILRKLIENIARLVSPLL
jgi:cardiolipin synthase